MHVAKESCEEIVPRCTILDQVGYHINLDFQHIRVTKLVAQAKLALQAQACVRRAPDMGRVAHACALLGPARLAASRHTPTELLPS